jgi:hypothetical protein
MALELPRDEHNSTETVRRMLEEALTARLTDAKKKELTPEEGMLLQQSLQQVSPAYSLLAMDAARGSSESPRR